MESKFIAAKILFYKTKAFVPRWHCRENPVPILYTPRRTRTYVIPREHARSKRTYASENISFNVHDVPRMCDMCQALTVDDV